MMSEHLALVMISNREARLVLTVLEHNRSWRSSLVKLIGKCRVIYCSATAGSVSVFQV